jgi:hypothetical protein
MLLKSSPATDNRCVHGVMWGDRTDVCAPLGPHSTGRATGIMRCGTCQGQRELRATGLPVVLARRPDLPLPAPMCDGVVIRRLAVDLFEVRFDAHTFAAKQRRDLRATCPDWDLLNAMPIGVSLIKQSHLFVHTFKHDAGPEDGCSLCERDAEEQAFEHGYHDVRVPSCPLC